MASTLICIFLFYLILRGTLDLDCGELKKSIYLGAFKWSRHNLESFAHELVSGSATISPDARKRKREKQLLPKDFRKFKYSEIVTGTRNFNEIIGFGGTSKVYKMNFPLSSSTFYAVKRFKTDKKSRKSYHNELETMSGVRHENILELKGWCDMDTGENLLVFDYMPQGSLHYALHSRKNQLLSWTKRYAITIKLATALNHLHEECSPNIVHGDIKGSNILLDDEYQPKLGDFGISLNGAPYKAVGASKQYSAPECKPKSVLDVKAYVYSDGVLVLEICRGRMAKDTAEGFVSEVSEVSKMESDNRLLEAADERLRGCFNPEEMMKLLKVGLHRCGQREEAYNGVGIESTQWGGGSGGDAEEGSRDGGECGRG